MLWLYRLLRGCLYIEISGEGAERLLSRCARRGILLWNSARCGSTVRCRIGVEDFRRMRKIIPGCGARVHIITKTGMPFLIKRYSARAGIPVGAALFLAILIYLSGFVWSVEVEGNKRLSKEEIIAECAALGFSPGTPKRAVKPGLARQELLLKKSGLSWCAFNLEGCRLTVEISETEPVNIAENAPCDLKAAADGIVTEINVTAGKCLVKVGDTVRRGELLVSGVEERNGATVFVHSAGSITAVTERELTVEGNYLQRHTEKSGRECTKRVLSAFGVKIPLYVGAVTGEYESEKSVKKLFLFGKELPLVLYEKKYRFTEVREEELTADALENRLFEELEEKARVEISGDYEVKNREFDEIEGGLRLKTLISTETDIAIQDIILFYAGNS